MGGALGKGSCECFSFNLSPLRPPHLFWEQQAEIWSNAECHMCVFGRETQHFDESLLGCECGWVINESNECVRACVCMRACALLIPEGLFEGFLCRFCRGGRWVLGVFHSDVISPDNGLVKAGILRAPYAFDCMGQLWRNGHYLPVSGSIKKPPAPVAPVLRVPTGGGTCAGHRLALKKWKQYWWLTCKRAYFTSHFLN